MPEPPFDLEPAAPSTPPAAPPVLYAASAQPSFISDLPPVNLDANGNIIDDLTCRRCGYSLRGLAPAGVCPECGTAIGRSIHGDLLRFSDPSWIERVATGVRLLVIAFIISIAGGMLIGLVFAALGIFSGGSTWIMMAVLIVFMIGTSIINIIGYWMSTTPDPGTDESDQPMTARAIARWCIVAQAAVSFIAVPFQMNAATMFSFGGGSTGLEVALLMLLEAMTIGFGIVGMVAMLAYARRLALRLPHEGIARHCRIVMIGYGIGGSLLFFAAMLELPTGGDPTHPMTEVAGAVNMIGSIPALIFGIWALVLLFRFRSRLRTAAQQAREIWAQSAR